MCRLLHIERRIHGKNYYSCGKEGRKRQGSSALAEKTSDDPCNPLQGGGSLPIKLPKKEITQFINTTAGQQIMVNLQFTDGESKLALMKEYQVDPTQRELLHADFFEISLTEKVRVSVQITPTGEPVGVKRDGGLLQNVLREIEIECLPDKIPGKMKIDISGLEIGQALHVSDLSLSEDIKVLTDLDEVIVNIIAPLVEQEVAPAEEAAPETAEPEIAKKGKKEEEGEAAEKEKEKEKK
ncbi:MAG: 50S ribosomal protein L25 [Thermodesulfovibrionales bacterium]|nr:50S ribosomal protein L25 [Thermodesulfovibrionales bacterium]